MLKMRKEGKMRGFWKRGVFFLEIHCTYLTSSWRYPGRPSRPLARLRSSAPAGASSHCPSARYITHSDCPAAAGKLTELTDWVNEIVIITSTELIPLHSGLPRRLFSLSLFITTPPPPPPTNLGNDNVVIRPSKTFHRPPLRRRGKVYRVYRHHSRCLYHWCYERDFAQGCCCCCYQRTTTSPGAKSVFDRCAPKKHNNDDHKDNKGGVLLAGGTGKGTEGGK